jgi:phage-related protein
MRQSFYVPALLHPAAREALRAFPGDVRWVFGKAIYDLQIGCALAMPLSRPMPAVGAGVSAIRVHDASGAYRAFYVVRTAQAVLVFHVFVKKTRVTPQREIRLGKRRLKEMLP